MKARTIVMYGCGGYGTGPFIMNSRVHDVEMSSTLPVVFASQFPKDGCGEGEVTFIIQIIGGKTYAGNWDIFSFNDDLTVAGYIRLGNETEDVYVYDTLEESMELGYISVKDLVRLPENGEIELLYDADGELLPEEEEE